MSRPRKPKKVDTLKHAGYEIPIFFDANPKALNFLAEFGGTWHGSPQAGELKEKLKKLIQQVQDLEWLPLITVAYSVNNPRLKHVGFIPGTTTVLLSHPGCVAYLRTPYGLC